MSKDGPEHEDKSPTHSSTAEDGDKNSPTPTPQSPSPPPERSTKKDLSLNLSEVDLDDVALEEEEDTPFSEMSTVLSRHGQGGVLRVLNPPPSR